MLRRCQHRNTRCIHGDEILDRMKVYIVRFWKDEVVYRQACMDCGKALDRPPICADGGLIHIHRELSNQCDCSVHDITRLGAAHADDCPMAD